MKTRSAITLLFISCAILATALEAPQVKITEAKGKRIIISNGIPDHATGQFPNPGNPNSISAQRYEFRMTLTPKSAAKPLPANHASFGIAVNGVPFEAGTAEFWNGDRAWNYEAKSGKIDLGLDQNDAHVQPGGVYHYHGPPTGLIAKLGTDSQMIHIGWAADGFPIYARYGYTDANNAASPIKTLASSWRLQAAPDAGRPATSLYPMGSFVQDYEYVAGLGDLDQCNGRTGVTPEFPGGIYHYMITTTFPFVHRCVRGTPSGGGPPPPG